MIVLNLSLALPSFRGNQSVVAPIFFSCPLMFPVCSRYDLVYLRKKGKNAGCFGSPDWCAEHLVGVTGKKLVLTSDIFPSNSLILPDTPSDREGL